MCCIFIVLILKPFGTPTLLELLKLRVEQRLSVIKPKKKTSAVLAQGRSTLKWAHVAETKMPSVSWTVQSGGCVVWTHTKGQWAVPTRVHPE